MLSKCPTGIQGLDEITNGGLPRGRPTLVCGKPGCGKTLMAMEFLVKGALHHQEPGVFMSFEEPTEELIQNMASLGWDLKMLMEQHQLAIDYVYIERTQIQETGVYDLEALFMRLSHAIDRVQAKRVVLDTLEVLFGGLSNEAIVRSELRRLFLWLKEKGVTAIITGEAGQQSLTRQGLEEYVSDCVIRLDQRLSNELSTRFLQVLKYRGSAHGSNEYPFLIEQTGISVLPITSVGLDYAVSSDRITTGIPRLDAMLGGKGFFRGSSILISGTAGTGKSSLCASFANTTCEQQERCLYLAFEESPQQIIRNMRSLGIDLTVPIQQGLLKFQALRPTFYGLEMHLVKIHQLVQDIQPTVVIIDPISSLLTAGTSMQVKSFMMRLVDFLKTQQITTLFTNLILGGGPHEQTEIGISSLMDTWLMLRDQENNGERNRLLYVLKARGMSHSNQVREFRLTDTGIQLVDVYVGAGGALAGTARAVQEAQERMAVLARQQAIERKQRAIERKRLLIEAQIATLQAEFESEKTELEQLIQQEELQEKTLFQDQQMRAQLRQADSLNDLMT